VVDVEAVEVVGELVGSPPLLELPGPLVLSVMAVVSSEQAPRRAGIKAMISARILAA
jgi:hypothetical protein